MTIQLLAPKLLVEQHPEDVLDPTIVIDVDNQTFTYDCNSDHIQGQLDDQALDAIGRMLVWALKIRITSIPNQAPHAADDFLTSLKLSQVELF